MYHHKLLPKSTSNLLTHDDILSINCDIQSGQSPSVLAEQLLNKTRLCDVNHPLQRVHVSPPCCRAPHPQSFRVVQKGCFAAALCSAVQFQRLSREIQVEWTGFLQKHTAQAHTAKPITGVMVLCFFLSFLNTRIDIARPCATAY